MDFGAVLSRAWNIIWRYKVLWIFGILAGCGEASPSSTLNSRYNFGQRDFNFNGNLPPQMQAWIDRISQTDPLKITLFFLVLFVIGVVLFLIGVILNTLGRVGMVRGTQLADGNPERIDFSDLLNAGGHFFWRVFAVNLLFGVLFLLLALVIGAPLVICTFGLGLFCLIPLMWFFQLLLEQINIAIVIEDLGIGAGIQRGWEVVTRNLGSMIVMALILYIASLVVGLLLGLPFLLIAGPAIAGYILGTTQNLQTAFPGGLIVAGLCLVAYIPVLLVLGGILRAYVASAWTLTYMRLTHPPVAVEEVPPAI